MSKRAMLTAIVGGAVTVAAQLPTTAMNGDTLAADAKTLIAHRGASAYAPEHTLAAYQLAIEQGADFVEQDLGLTKDRQLVCLHDVGLERTTNVEEVFPDRFVEVKTDQGVKKTWPVYLFTLAEIRRLDAGSWFSPRFAGEKVPTWQEAIDLVRGKAGLYPELKSPEVYREQDVDMAPLVIASLRANGLDGGGATPLILQSFDETTLRHLAQALPSVPRVLLTEPAAAASWLTPDGLREAATFVTGIGPAKGIIESRPEIVEWAHAAGLSVTPYTFRSTSTGRFGDVRTEMAYFLFDLGVDALFTDNPDRFPRSRDQPP